MHTDRIAFDAIRTACWRDNGRQYRVFLRDGELLFLHVGQAAGSRPQITGTAGIEGLVAAVVIAPSGGGDARRSREASDLHRRDR